jgi:two-component system sensor kinase FixL
MENSDAKQLVIRSSLHGSNEVEVSICDSGCGLGAISTETIFGHFYTTKPDGLGVGLAISQSIIEAHGGDLTAERNAERGMTFGFRLPRIPLDHSEEI